MPALSAARALALVQPLQATPTAAATSTSPSAPLPWRLLWTTWDTTAACSIQKESLGTFLSHGFPTCLVLIFERFSRDFSALPWRLLWTTGLDGSVQHKKESLGTYLSHGFPKKKTTTLLDYEAALRVRVQIGIVCALAFSHLNSMFLCPGWPSR